MALLLILLPMILRFLAKIQGDYTGMAIELSVQKYYFAFLFVQVFPRDFNFVWNHHRHIADHT